MLKVIEYILILVVIIFTTTIANGQITPTKTVRIQNSTTLFGSNLPEGTIILDVSTEKIYQTIKAVEGTNSISSLQLGIDYREFIADIPFDATTWNNNLDAPTKNTVRDELVLKENTANKSAETTLGNSDVLFPTQNAVKTYVDDAIAITGSSSQTLSEILASNTSAGSHKITDLADPTSAQGAATKKYVDDALGTGGASTLSVDNGLTNNIGVIELGGTLNKNTAVLFDGNSLQFGDNGNTYGAFQTFDQSNQISMGNISTDYYNELLISETNGSVLTYANYGTSKAYGVGLNDSVLAYAGDYSADYTNRSLVDKAYVQSQGNRSEILLDDYTQPDNITSSPTMAYYRIAPATKDLTFSISGALPDGFLTSIVSEGDGTYKTTVVPAVAAALYDETGQNVASIDLLPNLVYNFHNSGGNWFLNKQGGSGLTAGIGLTENAGKLDLGGILDNTDVGIDVKNGSTLYIGTSNEFDDSGLFVTSNGVTAIYGSALDASGTFGAVTVLPDQVNITAQKDGINQRHAVFTTSGFEYDVDLSASNTTNPRWIPDKEYVDDAVSSAGSGSVTTGNGLTNNAGTVELGGTLNKATEIDGDFNLDFGNTVPIRNMNFTISNSFEVQTQGVGDFNISNGAGIILSDLRDPGDQNGLQYNSDYSADYTDRSLVDKAYVDNQISGISAHDALTLGTANGLIISGQQLSLDEATSGSSGAMSAADKSKLDGIEAFAEVNRQADWTETNSSLDSYIIGKPSLATVATSGSYTDLSDRPDLNGYLTAEVDGDITNEGSLTVGEGSASTSVINSNTTGSTGITLEAGTNISLTESGNTITIATTGAGADDQTAAEVSYSYSISGLSAVNVQEAIDELNGNMSASSSFSTSGNITSNSPGNLNADSFVFGSSSLNDVAGTEDDRRMVFDKSNSSFRVGIANGDQWNLNNRGDNSAAFGENTIASGTNTTAFGYNTRAEAQRSFAIGQYNVGGGTATGWIDTDPLFEIGNGIADGSRSNALTVFKNGNVELIGTLKVGNYTLPGTDGLADQVLATDGSGIVEWISQTGEKTLSEILDSNTSAGSHRITDLVDPVDDQDAATKKYVTDQLANIVSSDHNNDLTIGSDGGAFIDVSAQEVTTTLIDNADGTFTYTDELGVPTIISKAKLTDNLDGSFTFTNNNGVDVIIPMISTTLYQELSTGVISYTNEDGNVESANIISTDPENDITVGTDGGAFIDVTAQEVTTTLIDNANGTFTYNNEVGDATIINKASLTDNGDGSFTFTNNNGSDVIIPLVATSLEQEPSTSVITFTNEVGTKHLANVLSADSENALHVGSDGGVFIHNSNFEKQSLSEILATNNSAGTQKITELVNPTDNQDAATKKYVDDAFMSIDASPVTLGTANGLSLSGQQLSLNEATSGSSGAMSAADKSKLEGIEAFAEVNRQVDWTETNSSLDSYIIGKPTLATVATSGSYTDLSDRPDLNGFLTTEVDGDITNEGSLTVGEGSASTSVINSNTTGSTGVTLEAGTNISLTESGNTITIAAIGSASSPFATAVNVTSNSPGILDTDDFVFGSTSLNDATGTGDNSRMFFDKSKSAFRAGYADWDQWDDSKRGIYSAAFGQNTTVSGDWSAAFGLDNLASGEYSAVFNRNNIADAIYSTAFGYYTKANALNSFAVGKFNVGGGDNSTWVDTDPLFEIGNGTYEIPANALTVRKNGNTEVGRNLTVTKDLIVGSPTTTHMLLDIGSLMVAEGAEIDGDLWVDGNLETPSDIRLKTNIETLTNVLEKIDQLRGVRFEYKDQTKYATGPKIGVIAQELQQVYPELVKTGEDGFLAVDYTQITAILIQAVKEQQKEIIILKQQMYEVMKKLNLN